ncbi:MAG: glutamyl-tRNA reductase [Trueperaceae bacterium]|nr:glutamyl-tRNA reductase [Trueperaceae bacterium]
MDGLTLIGVSHRRGGIDALETWHERLRPDDVAAHLLAVGVSSWVTIATCNRWDVVLARPPGVDLATVRAALTPSGAHCRPYAYEGEAALEHLTRVAASLESLNPGEDQIMRQVRDAYALARRSGRDDATLAFAFDTALRLAKRVRREVALAPLNTSLFSLARSDLERVLAHGGRALVVGAGEMGELAARALGAMAGVRVSVANRDFDKAERVARAVGGEAIALDDLAATPRDAEVLVAATPVRALVGERVLRAMPSLRLAIDLGVPRTVDQAAAAICDVEVIDVARLQVAGEARRRALVGRLGDAERVVLSGLDEAVGAWNERQLAPSIRAIVDHYLELVGDRLPPAEAERLARAVARVPIKGLRAVAREYGMAAASTFLAETGLHALELESRTRR